MYIISAPPYTHKSAGTKVLYELSYLLNNHGCESYMFVWDGKSYLSDKYKICSYDFMMDSLSKGAWIVYPEIISGNPVGAKNVIRYVLNVPGLLAGDKTYDSSEILFAYNSYISKHAWNCPILKTPHVNLDICRNYNLSRKGSCFFVGKGRNVPRRPELEEIEIINVTSQQLYDLFNRCEVFYTYDDMTSLCEEARLCGCPVVILNEFSDKFDLLRENKYGMAFGLSELGWAKKTVHKFKKRYIEQYSMLFEKQLKLFLRKTNESKNKKCNCMATD